MKTPNSEPQIKIRKTEFGLLSKAKTIVVSGTIANPMLNKDQQQLWHKIVLQTICSAAAQSRSPRLNKGQQQLLCRALAVKNLRRSVAIAKPKIKQGTATIIAQNRAAKNKR